MSDPEPGTSCSAINESGEACKNPPLEGGAFCRAHKPAGSLAEAESKRRRQKKRQQIATAEQKTADAHSHVAKVRERQQAMGRLAARASELAQKDPGGPQHYVEKLRAMTIRVSMSCTATHRDGEGRIVHSQDEDGIRTYQSEDGKYLYRIVDGKRHVTINLSDTLEFEDTLSTDPLVEAVEDLIEQAGLEEARGDTVRARRPHALSPLGLSGYFPTPADRVNAAVIESLAPGAIQKGLSADLLRKHGFTAGEAMWAVRLFRGGAKNEDLRGGVGFSREPDAAVWDTLQKRGALAVKAQYALWARAYAETDAAPGQYLRLSVPQFCEDLGYTRHHRGGFKREQKQQAIRVLELLTSMELSATYQPPNKKPQRLRGPIWARGVIGEEYDGYADLFGSQREGDPSLWDPVAFSYAPGDWFSDPVWRAYNRNVALVGAGLLELRTDRDEWTIMVGGYLGTLSRMNGYKPSVLRVATLLDRTGLLRADSRNPGRAREKLWRALDQLGALDKPVIAGWRFTDAETSEPDMDNPDELAALKDTAGPQKRVEIYWPADLGERAKRLTAQKEKHKLRERNEREKKRLTTDSTQDPPTLVSYPPHAGELKIIHSRDGLTANFYIGQKTPSTFNLL